MMVQSNNATYGGTGQIEQQFAITRARAMEARREIAVATTNSVSGFIDRDGTVVQRTDEFTAAGMVVRMPRRSELTPAIRVAPWLDRGLAAVGLGCCVAGFVLRRRSGSVRAGRRWRPRPNRVLVEPGGVRMSTPDRRQLGRILIIIPTYNEAENIVQIVTRARTAVPQADVLVADDNSPDGTGKLADGLAAADDQRARDAPAGQGRSRGGVPRRLRVGHQRRATTCWWRWTPTGRTSPSSCRCCWRRCVDADLVLGSRWVKGGKVVNWPKSREFSVQGRKPVDPDGAGHPAPGRHRRLPASSGGRPCSGWAWTTSPRPGTASRSTSPGGR